MRWLVPLITCHVLLWAWSAGAQQPAAPASTEPAPPPSQAAPEAPSEVLKEAPPIYMKDADGKPQAMLGWTLKDFEALRERADAQKRPDPRHILESLSVTGTAKGDLAELTVEIKIWASGGEVRVPLRLDQAILRPEGVLYEGSGQAVLQFEQGGEGHVLWIRGDPNQRHHLTLRVVVPLSTVGDEARLRLFVPQATTSELKLTVPLAGAVAKVSDGATLLPPAAGEGNSTVFTVGGFAGQDTEAAKFNDFQLSWREAQSRLPEMRPVLETTAVLLAKVDRRSVTTEATLTVRGHGGPFDRFRVSLPNGAQLIPSNGAGYSVTAVPKDQTAGDETLVEVRRDKESPEPMEQVRLTTRQTREAAGAGGWFELGGFEVIDAVRQSGYLGVDSEGDWQVRCVPGRGVRQIDTLPEPLETSKPIAGVDYLFEYFSQPFSLAARVVEVKTRIRVEPEYKIYVEDDQARLEAKLKYTIRGAKAFVLALETPGWQLDEVGPDVVVEVDDVSDQSGVVSIPLSQPSLGEVEVTIRAHQEIEPGTASLSLALPRPRADSVSPAVVAVLPADNVELVPRPQAMVGLVRQQVVPQMEFRQGQQDPFFYRGETTEAVFEAGFKVQEQKIAVDVTSEVTLGDQKAEVRQTLAYTIAYEPLEELTIDVPTSLARPGALEVLLDGQSVATVSAPEQTHAPGATRPVRKRIMLPAAKIGRCELGIGYSTELEELLPEASVVCKVPLVMPVQGEPFRNELYVTAPQGIEVQCRGQGWRPSGSPAGRLPRHNNLTLSSDQRIGEVSLGINYEDLVATVVERAWVQTCLTHNARHERAVFCFTSDQKELELILPGGFDVRQARILLGPENVEDRERVRVQTTPEGHLVIPLSGDSSHRRQWLEVQYDFSGPRPEPGRLSLELPHLRGEVWVQRTYWELVLPRNEHVIVGPGGLTPEYRWAWTGSFWGRKPLMEQPQLEEWSAAQPQREVPKASSRYLFSSLDPVTRCELRTADRWWIVLGASSVVLVAGLLLIYVPACRHPAALLAVAVALVGAAVSYPGPALLASQAASLGLALALLAGLLYRTVGPERGRILRREPSSSIVERTSTQAQYRPPVASKPASTETAPAEISMPTPDSSP